MRLSTQHQVSCTTVNSLFYPLHIILYFCYIDVATWIGVSISLLLLSLLVLLLAIGVIFIRYALVDVWLCNLVCSLYCNLFRSLYK